MNRTEILKAKAVLSANASLVIDLATSTHYAYCGQIVDSNNRLNLKRAPRVLIEAANEIAYYIQTL